MPLRLAAVAIFLASAAAAGETSSLRTEIRGTGLASFAPDDPVLFPVEESAQSLWRMRLTWKGRPGEGALWELAYEQRARLVSSGAGAAAGSGILPSTSEPAFRLESLDRELASDGAGGTWSYRHEVDRAFVALDFHLGGRKGELTVGRQAVGMGRGTSFSAVDIFAPFSPLETDRDWRRGVDAARVELPLSDTWSFDLTCAFGATRDQGAAVGRLRGRTEGGGADAELILGRRAADDFLALTTSFPVRASSMYLELAAFRTPEHAGRGGLFGADHLVGKAVLGLSTSAVTPAGRTVFVSAEYHYSGFGVRDADDLAARLADPVFVERLARGDTQILSQEALALAATWELSDTWSLATTWMAAPSDGSGVVSASFTWDFSRDATMAFALYAGYGSDPSGGALESFHGATPTALLFQFRAYY